MNLHAVRGFMGESNNFRGGWVDHIMLTYRIKRYPGGKLQPAGIILQTCGQQLFCCSNKIESRREDERGDMHCLRLNAEVTPVLL